MMVVHVTFTGQAQLHYTSKTGSLNVKADGTYRNLSALTFWHRSFTFKF
jgi:hypothetical protein